MSGAPYEQKPPQITSDEREMRLEFAARKEQAEALLEGTHAFFLGAINKTGRLEIIIALDLTTESALTVLTDIEGIAVRMRKLYEEQRVAE